MNILDTLKPSQLNKVKIVDLEKDSILYRENDKCNSIGIILKGKVSIISYLENGNEIIFNVLNTNDIFGNNLIFSSNPYYKGNIITNEASKIALIQKQDLINFLKTNESFMVEYLKIQSNFTKTLNDRIKLLSLDSAEDRLNYYLHENNKEIEYVSISDLARHLYLKRETLSRLLSKLVKQNKIIKTKNTIKLK